MNTSKIYDDKSRQLVSFEGACPFSCLHCYTFCEGYENSTGSTIPDIIDTLKGKDFNVVYVSGHKENFIDPDLGLRLCEEIFREFYVDILITTRNVFRDEHLQKLDKLQKEMRAKNNHIYFCVSVPAYDSHKKLEPNRAIPIPSDRIAFLKKVYQLGINTILTIRPLCPSEFIPDEEALKIIEECKCFSSAVLVSGIVVNEQILHNLGDFPKNYSLLKEGVLMDCLGNDLLMRYVDVSKELKKISDFCNSKGVPFFEKSLDAINYIQERHRR